MTTTFQRKVFLPPSLVPSITNTASAMSQSAPSPLIQRSLSLQQKLLTKKIIKYRARRKTKWKVKNILKQKRKRLTLTQRYHVAIKANL